MKKIICVIGLLLATNIGAQQLDEPRSRFTGNIGGCSSCDERRDGIMHFRFSPDSGLVTETIGGNPVERFKFIVQVRASRSNPPQLLMDSGLIRTSYNVDAFPRLSDPTLVNTSGQNNPAGKCTVTRAPVFTTEGTTAYDIRIANNADGLMTLTETSKGLADASLMASAFGTITNQFEDFMILSCNIDDTNAEAGFSFNGSDTSGNGIREILDLSAFNDIDKARQNPILPVADNDFRGFRLDGKTWAEDYSRYSDGMGVRLKFSKGVYADNSGTKAALTADNFLVYDSGGATDTISITGVDHTADDDYVKITIDTAAVGGLIRLVSNAASTVKDTDDNELADGNFVASLEYDADAPRVSRIEKDDSYTPPTNRPNLSQWVISLNDPIHVDTAIKENLCLTEQNGACAAADAEPTTLSIVSVTPSIVSVIGGTPANPVTSETTTSKVTVVVNEGPGKTGGMRSIEFRRNAILAGNLYIAEDYQTELRDKIELTNRIGPVITVDDAAMRPNPNNDGNYFNYEISFTVTADEDVPSLADPAAYGLRRFVGNSPEQSGFTVNSSDPPTDLMLGGRPNRQVRLVYNVTFETAAIVRAAEMALVRASNNSLTDGDTINPLGPTFITRSGLVLEVSSALDEDGAFYGRVPIATIPSGNGPIITAVADGDANVDSATEYSGSFTVTVADASNSVPNLKNTSSYLLLRKIRANDTLAPVTGATLTAADGSTTRTATINFSATLADLDAARETEYFTLGRSNPMTGRTEELLDIYSRQPLSSADGNPAIDRGARISTGAASQANRVADNPRLIVMATGQKANPASSNANQYTMTFEIDARDVESTDAKNLSDIGDKTAYTLIHIPTSGQPINLATDNSITVTSTGDTLAGSIADIQYTVTFTDIADTQRTKGFTIGYAGNDKLLAPNGDKPQRGNSSPIADGDPIAIVTGGVVASAAVAARDTDPPYLTITNNPTDTVATTNNVTYTFNFTVTPSNAVQSLPFPGSYGLLVAGTEADISNNLIKVPNTSNNIAVSYSADDRPVTIRYRIALSDIRTLLGESNNNFVPYGFLLARANNAFRDTSNNEPVQVGADGNPTTATLSSDNTVQSVLQLGKVAVLDQDAPVITLTADTEAVPDDDNRFGEVYDMTFTVEASEDVTGIGDIDNYTLMRVKANNTVVPAVISGDPNAIRVSSSEDDGNPADNAMGDEASFTYTVTFRRNDDDDLDNRIRDTKGFTLALVAGRLQDAANNPPVNTNNEEIYDSSNALQRQGLIPPKPSNAAPEVIAARDTTSPSLRYGPRGMAIPNDDDPTIYSGSFTVSSVDNIRDIGTPGAYQLTRLRKNNAPLFIRGGSVMITSPSDNDANRDGMSAIINFSGADIGDLDAARDTRGFGLALNTDGANGTWLRDYSNNNAVVSGSSLQKDITDPVITVRAVDIAGDIGTDSDGVFAEPSYTSGEYTMQFRVTASEEVPTLNNTASYNLVGIDISDGTTATIVQNNVTPALEDGHTTTQATITYTVTDITDPTSLAGFTLVRNGAESLRDKSGNLPAADVGTRLDSNAASIALRDTTPPRLTVTAQGTSPKAVPTADDGTAYSMTFVINSTEFLRIPGATEDRYFLASVDTSSSATITNLNIEADNATVIVENEITLPFTISGITDPTNIKAFTLVRRGDLMIDFSGNPVVRHDGSAIAAVGDVIDNRDTALADRDTTAPKIEVGGVLRTTDAKENGNYEIQLRMTADEDVKDANNAASYRLIRVKQDDSYDATVFSSVDPFDFGVISANRIYQLFYRFNPITLGLTRTQIRNTKGFTLARVGATSLIDRSGNQPVKLDGTTAISPIGGGTDAEVLASLIGPLSGGVLVSGITPRENTPPRLTVTATTPTISIGSNDITLSGTFTVEATENVLGIGSTNAYVLLRQDDGNFIGESGSPLTRTSGSDNGDMAVFNYSHTFTGTSARQDLRDTEGFTLGRVDNATASNTLIDYASNIPVDPGNTSNQINSENERLDSRSSAISVIDKSAPSLTVTAQTTGDITGVRDGTNNTYTMQFTINSDKAIADIGDPAAYTLMRIPSGGGAAVATTTTNGNRDSGSLAGTQATISFTGQFTAADIAAEQGTAGFTLGRATDADSGTNCRLCSLASSKPIRGGGSSGSGDIEAGERIDNTAMVSRDTTAPQIAVESDGTLRQLATADLNGSSSGLQADGAFHVRFKLEGNYDDVPDIVGALVPGFRSGFRVLRKHSGSDTYSVVLRQDLNPGAPALPVVSRCRELQGVNLVDIPNCYYLSVGDVTLSAADAANTDYLTLGRASGRLRDASNNEPVVFGSNTPVRAVGDPLGPLPFSTTSTANLLLERNEPSITVSLIPPGETEPLSFFRIGDQICGSFFVSAADANGDEPIDGINEAGSYRLLSIASDGTATELTTAGGDHESCEGEGSVISRVTPEATNLVPFPSLLNARVYFNVVDAGVTTAQYTLGRKVKLTDISGNAPVDPADNTRAVTTAADATGRIDGRSTSLGITPAGDTSVPIITATVQDTDGDTNDGVEAIAVAPHPLTFSGSFRVAVEQPDDPADGEENVARIGDTAAYRVVYLSIANNAEVAIADYDITIDPNSVTPNRAATVGFTARLPNLTAVQDAAAFKLRPVNLTDEGGNRPLNNQFTDTDLGDDDSRVARRERTSPQITITAVDQTATADANDNYTMQFTVSADEAVPTLGTASAYDVIRIKNDNSIAFDANATAGTSVPATADREYTISYTADLSSLSGAERRLTKGFTLARASTMTLVDRSGNPPVKGDGSTAIGENDPIAAVDNNGVVGTAIAARETVRPQIEVRPVLVDGFGAVPDADNPTSYEGRFTVRSVTGEPIKGLGLSSNYEIRRVLKDGSISFGGGIINSDDFGATVNVTLSFKTFFTGFNADAIIRNTTGIVLATQSLAPFALTDYASNLPQGVNAGGDRIDSSDAAIALRDTQGPQITVMAGDDGAEADEADPLLYTGSFRVAAPVGKTITGLGTAGSYKLLRIDAEDNPIDVTTATIRVTAAQAANASTATLTFTATLADIAEVQDSKGFTLGYAANLLDPLLRNLPVQFVNGQLDEEAAALAARDTTAPRITVLVQGEAAEEDTNDGTGYTIVFNVSADDDRIRDIDADSSYQLLRTVNGDSVIDSRATIEASAAQANASTATVTAGIELTDAEVSETEGFTLARGSDVSALRDMASNDPVDAASGDAVTINTRIDSRPSAEARIITVRVECAPFYPNIGQQDLFFRITSESDINLNGLTLTQVTQGTTTTLFSNTDTATRLDDGSGESAILQVALGSEITGSASIDVDYEDSDRTVGSRCVIDNLANLTDSDSDGVNDIVDSNPYDGTETDTTNIAMGELADKPAETDIFYNRQVLVRSLLRGNQLTYVANNQSGETETTDVAALTAAEYFGIDYADNTRLLSDVASGSDCALMLAAAQANKLSQVSLDAFCASEDEGDATEYDFLAEMSPAVSRRYAWVGVDGDGHLQPSGEYPDYTITALPEINIAGQSSYFYDIETTKSVVVSAYAPEASDTAATVTMAGVILSGGRIADETVALTKAAGAKVFSGRHSVTGYERHPQAGQTIRRWLSGSSAVWQAAEATLELPDSGGYTQFDAAKYAIGDHSYVDVRVSKAGSDEPITEIHNLLLYDVTQTTVSRVTSAVQGRNYYLIADLTTNIADISSKTEVASMEVAGYSILNEDNVVIRRKIGIEGGNLLEQENFEIIAFQVNSDAGDTITVGWDKIGTAENVLATYRVTTSTPVNYNLPGFVGANDDNDGDRIRNGLDADSTSDETLQVAVDGPINPFADYLTATDEQPLYASDEGLIIAFSKGDDMQSDYSAANIDYPSLTADTKVQLGVMDDENNSITSLATFGIRSVDYAFSQADNADAMAAGGVAYAVFPVPAGMSEPLYISRYNNEDERWERFERGTHRDGYVDIWYAIDRDGNTACATDVEIYRNEHMATGDDDLGFTANTEKCVMMAITDGGPYDNSAANGRVDALLAMGTTLQSPSRGLQCAAFFPNVGQRDLFFELDGISLDGSFVITQGDNPLTFVSETRINADAMEGVDPVVRVRLSTEIVSDDPIDVTYTADGEANETMCVASFVKDTDEDDVADIADINPFDPDDDRRNPDIAGPPTGDDVLFVEDNDYYSRKVIVRSLLRGEEFTYIEEENGEPVREENTLRRTTRRSNMTPQQYFGVAADARIYEYSVLCKDILAAAQANGLTRVRIGEFCTKDITADFVNVVNNDFVTKGRDGHRYLWATVRGGLLVSSYTGEEDDDLKILPEINFLGQDTYLFASTATTKFVVISSYVKDPMPMEIANILMKGASYEGNDFSEDDTEVALKPTMVLKDAGTILSRQDITYGGAHPPRPGETITRWLSAPMNPMNIWQPTGLTLETKSNGHDSMISNYDYAIGTHNIIDIRVANPETDAPVTEIRQVLLYEVTNDMEDPIRKVTSMVAGGTYYAAVDFDTNIADEDIEIEPAVQHMDLYDIIETTATDITRVEGTGHLEKEKLAIIVIEVDDDISTDTDVITVGWDTVGSVDDVISRYLVRNTALPPAQDANQLTDSDLDGIPDAHDKHIGYISEDMEDDENSPDHNNRLQVVDDNNEILDGTDYYLTTQDGDPTFLTYEGIVIADALNNNDSIKAINYSVVNNGDLTGETQKLLDITINDADEIDTLVTFGVASVEYGFELDENTGRAEPTGGQVYASFPIFVDVPADTILYLGKYDYDSGDDGSWVRFERGNANTWYAIDRPDSGACPTDVQVYQNEHQAAGEDGMGFTAGDIGNCIMLVLTDGERLYDSSSLDTRVLDPLSVGTRLFAGTSGGTTGGGGGGGGAIGVSDILLLIGALLLITIVSRRRRKAH